MTIQISGSLLDVCVLSIINQQDTYGYELTQNMKNLFGVSESTLYPVMRRLQKENCLRAYDRPYNGRNRRYYSLTPAGRKKYQAGKWEWQENRDKINNIMKGDDNG